MYWKVSRWEMEHAMALCVTFLLASNTVRSKITNGCTHKHSRSSLVSCPPYLMLKWCSSQVYSLSLSRARALSIYLSISLSLYLPHTHTHEEFCIV